MDEEKLIEEYGLECRGASVKSLGLTVSASGFILCITYLNSHTAWRRKGDKFRVMAQTPVIRQDLTILYMLLSPGLGLSRL